MAEYVDGFVLPIQKHRLDAYKELAAGSATIWKSHGALEYRENVLDVAELPGTGSFKSLDVADDEVVIFGWVVFSSRTSRDEVHARVSTDPQMLELMSTIDAGFDGERMLFGGFEPIVS